MRYVLHPGTVYSNNDGQRHYIGSQQLANLYNVKMRDCVVFARLNYIARESDIHLHPRMDGNYTLPTETSK